MSKLALEQEGEKGKYITLEQIKTDPQIQAMLRRMRSEMFPSITSCANTIQRNRILGSNMPQHINQHDSVKAAVHQPEALESLTD